MRPTARQKKKKKEDKSSAKNGTFFNNLKRSLFSLPTECSKNISHRQNNENLNGER